MLAIGAIPAVGAALFLLARVEDRLLTERPRAASPASAGERRRGRHRDPRREH